MKEKVSCDTTEIHSLGPKEPFHLAKSRQQEDVRCRCRAHYGNS